MKSKGLSKKKIWLGFQKSFHKNSLILVKIKKKMLTFSKKFLKFVLKIFNIQLLKMNCNLQSCLDFQNTLCRVKSVSNNQVPCCLAYTIMTFHASLSFIVLAHLSLVLYLATLLVYPTSFFVILPCCVSLQSSLLSQDIPVISFLSHDRKRLPGVCLFYL